VHSRSTGGRFERYRLWTILWNLICFDFITVLKFIKNLEARLTKIEEEIAECKKPQKTARPTTAEVTTVAPTTTIAPTTEGE